VDAKINTNIGSDDRNSESEEEEEEDEISQE
jgi:hypothetical protein